MNMWCLFFISKSFILYICASFQFSSVTQLCPTLWDSMNRSTPGLPVHHQLLEFTQTHVHWVHDAIQSSHPLSSPSLPALNLSQHQGLFKWYVPWQLQIVKGFLNFLLVVVIVIVFLLSLLTIILSMIIYHRPIVKGILKMISPLKMWKKETEEQLRM